MTIRHRHALLAAAALVLALAAAGCTCCGAPRPQAAAKEPTPAETTLTRVGQTAPDFTVATLDGGSFTLAAQRGRVTLVNWFATWCPPCQEEMPFLQREVWERFAGPDFAMISVAREQSAEDVAPFVMQRQLAWPFGLDPGREAYARYAEAFIPRNTVVGRDGRIVFQSEGFEHEEFRRMVDAIAAALGDAHRETDDAAPAPTPPTGGR